MPITSKDDRDHLMKVVSVILIIAYLLLPALCFGHPCDEFSAHADHSSIEITQCDESPGDHSDNCETACCCAGHVPTSLIHPPYFDITDHPLSKEPYLALPRMLDKIFVPPENHAAVARHRC